MLHGNRIARVLAVSTAAGLLAPWMALAQGNEPAFRAVPTLDGVGLAALAGALSVGGAWWLSRGKGKRD